MSRRLPRTQAERFVKALATLAKAQVLYPPGHGAVGRARGEVKAALQAVFADSRSLLMGTADGYLSVGDVAFLDDHPPARELATWLEGRELEGVVIDPEVEVGELARFCRWLRAPEDGAWTGDRVAPTPLERGTGVWDRAMRVYRTAVEVLGQACREVESGRIADPSRARECVRAFSELLAESPTVLRGLVLIKDYDRYTFHHSVNVCVLALGVGRRAGVDDPGLEELGLGALFHDIGKTRTPPDIVKKADRLTAGEWALMREHPVLGRDILASMPDLSPVTPRLVYEHHMRFDEGGYPDRPPAYRLHPLSPVITVCDVYDAVTTHRPYSAPLPPPEAVRLVAAGRGTHFSPEAAEGLLAAVGTIPVGTAVRLASGEVAVVSRLDDRGEPATARLVQDARGRALPEGRYPRRAVRASDLVHWVDPVKLRIDPAQVLRSR